MDPSITGLIGWHTGCNPPGAGLGVNRREMMNLHAIRLVAIVLFPLILPACGVGLQGNEGRFFFHDQISHLTSHGSPRLTPPRVLKSGFMNQPLRAPCANSFLPERPLPPTRFFSKPSG
jgi:hypothetical protein